MLERNFFIFLRLGGICYSTLLFFGICNPNSDKTNPWLLSHEKKSQHLGEFVITPFYHCNL